MSIIEPCTKVFTGVENGKDHEFLKLGEDIKGLKMSILIENTLYDNILCDITAVKNKNNEKWTLSHSMIGRNCTSTFKFALNEKNEVYVTSSVDISILRLSYIYNTLS
jgi:hypothetical protein